MWVEINERVNHPIKHCLVRLEENGEINIDDPHHKFCISWFTFLILAEVDVKAHTDSHMHSEQSQVSLVSRPHLSQPPEKVISKY